LDKEKIKLEYDNYKLATQSVGELIEKCEQNATLKAELESAKKFLMTLQDKLNNQQYRAERQLNEVKESLKAEQSESQRLSSELELKETVIRKLESKLDQVGSDHIENTHILSGTLILW
jgi:predicted RNase H-like nuclease (RuvC/YqgF family)